MLTFPTRASCLALHPFLAAWSRGCTSIARLAGGKGRGRGRERVVEGDRGRERGRYGRQEKSCPSARSVPCTEGERVLRGRGRGAEGDRGRERGRGCEGETCRRQGSLAHWKATDGVAHTGACTSTIYCNMHIHTYRRAVFARFALCVAVHVMDIGGHVVMHNGS